ncbi:uncharacterized protein LOC124454172 [Xenia sp. Carnegie-2017]|uniref:uncharacterized protein LOC124454172 n=1 Tax=Xenia sp. Carnegie-2017 TaxID=2897299 RepID=UPI001F037362|nr:uncharacterized protein LOC124454172 [Xenia sp. Carnegie-2017]
MAEQFSSASSDCSSSTPRNSSISFVMKWTAKHDVELCKEVVVSRLFETRKKSLERGNVWEAVPKKLEQHDHLCFRVDQHAVRDRVRKLLANYCKKEREEINASGISPEATELDDLLEEIHAREKASDVVTAEEASDVVSCRKKKNNADKEAAEEEEGPKPIRNQEASASKVG